MPAESFGARYETPLAVEYDLGQVLKDTMAFRLGRQIYTEDIPKLAGRYQQGMGGGDWDISFTTKYYVTGEDGWVDTMTWIIALPTNLRHDAGPLKFIIDGESITFSEDALFESVDITQLGVSGELNLTWKFSSGEQALGTYNDV